MANSSAIVNVESGARESLTESELDTMVAIVRAIESTEHLSAMGGEKRQWQVALEHMLELWRAPRNIDQAWMWSRFVWSFGDFKTWDANLHFNRLLAATHERVRLKRLFHDITTRQAKCSRVRFIERRRLDRQLVRCLQDIQQNLSELDEMLLRLLVNDKNWPDRESFARFAQRRAFAT